MWRWRKGARGWRRSAHNRQGGGGSGGWERWRLEPGRWHHSQPHAHVGAEAQSLHDGWGQHGMPWGALLPGDGTHCNRDGRQGAAAAVTAAGVGGGRAVVPLADGSTYSGGVTSAGAFIASGCAAGVDGGHCGQGGCAAACAANPELGGHMHLRACAKEHHASDKDETRVCSRPRNRAPAAAASAPIRAFDPRSRKGELLTPIDVLQSFDMAASHKNVGA
eukprot:736472-Pelagomonas_calceolata.AAC.3